MADQIQATFPGINLIRSCRYTRPLGVLPGIASLWFNPQPNLPFAEGTLTISHDGHGFVSFPECRIDQASIRITTEGHIERVRLFDRRYAWRYATVSAMYNWRDADGEIDSRTQKSAQEICQSLFQILDLPVVATALPANSYPFFNWICEPVINAIDQLCDEFGCDIDDNYLTLVPRVVIRGIGLDYPNNADVVSVGIGADFGEVPGEIAVCLNEDKFQSRLLLEPMAIETDGSIVRLPDVSYAPDSTESDGGWSKTVTNPDDPLPNAESKIRQLAARSVYKLWRVFGQATTDGSLDLTVPGYDGEIEKIEQLLPIHHDLVESYTDADELVTRQQPYCVGTFLAGGDPEPVANTEDCEFLTDTPQIIHEHGLVWFSNPIVKLKNPGQANPQYQPATLYLVCAYGVQETETLQYKRAHFRQTISSNRGELVVREDSLQRTFVAQYASCGKFTSVEDNEDELEPKAQEILDRLANSLQTVDSTEVIYRSIQPLAMDGARNQLQWTVDCRAGAFTRGMYNSETALGVMRRKERRRLLYADKQLAQAGVVDLQRRKVDRGVRR